VAAVIDTISKGASLADGEPLQDMNDGKYDFGFAVEWMRKDLSICLAESRATARASRSRRWSTPSMRKWRRWGASAGYVEPFARLER